MTHSMKAGRELDALVAEKVMGWKRLTYAQANPTNINFATRTDLTGYWHDKELRECARAEGSPDYYAPEEAWSPSTDISAAWEVVEKMISNSNYVSWKLTSEWLGEDPNDPDFLVYASFCLGMGQVSAGADTAPLAICLAALKAIGYIE